MEQPDVNLDAMALVSGSIKDLVDAMGCQERDAALQAHANPLDEGKHVNKMLSEFHATLESNPTGRFWLMYIHMVLILKRYIEAERAGLWQQHCHLVSAGHTKYVVCMPHYLHAMRHLPPDVVTTRVTSQSM